MSDPTVREPWAYRPDDPQLAPRSEPGWLLRDPRFNLEAFGELYTELTGRSFPPITQGEQNE